MYAASLFIHSWNRWILMLLLTTSVVATGGGFWRKSPYVSMLKGLRLGTVISMDLQLLLGIALYVMSPLTPGSMVALKASMHATLLRFFSVEHPFGMLLALVVVHVGSALAKRAPDGPSRIRRWGRASLVTVLLIFVGMPWPALPYGRPLFRSPLVRSPVAAPAP